MSTAREAKIKKEHYLQKVNLSNYKSIGIVEIELNPGLNVVIGKNGSGKTNFLTCLNNILRFDYSEQPDTESQIVAINKNGNFLIKAYIDNDSIIFNSQRELVTHSFNLLLNNIKSKYSDLEDIKIRLMSNGSLWSDRIITYANPYIDSLLIEKPISLTLLNNGVRSREGFSKTYLKTYFTTVFFFRLFNLFPIEASDVSFSIENIKETLLSHSDNIFTELSDNLKLYSPIKSIRINPDFNVLIEDKGRKVSITNFYIEFNINKKWLPFNFVSDGTKRLFYIISELTTYLEEGINSRNDDFDIVLLEEPELGIHPHQLHDLMLFIKEQSREKQIILTTHSPQVLDILSSDELNRIIICDYDKEKGTQLHHLNETQIKKAKAYMKKTFLSDYWRFSDLEPA